MSREDNDSFTAQKYVQDHGAKLYRRSMYTFVKRTAAHPTMTTFDAPDRQVCTVRRPRTNTPLQALVLMNDPTFVEAARKLAENAMLAESDDRKRVVHLYRRLMGRAPKAAEIEVLLSLQRAQAGAFKGDRGAAERFVSVGESARAGSLDVSDLAAWTMVASAILNLDETVTKG